MSKRVLVAEDFDDVRGMMKVFLEHDGFEVLEAADGYQAVERAVNGHPDLILMDIAMPVMDGIQATTAIRKHDDLAEVPIVAVTAYADFYHERALDVGCNDVIQKPVDFGRLRPLVRSYA
ncbi:MAG TPA: response regulator [Pyrinomonadaceae bacterium]|nr:response regulator [Pyrinomonadaceae bacterium]